MKLDSFLIKSFKLTCIQWANQIEFCMGLFLQSCSSNEQIKIESRKRVTDFFFQANCKNLLVKETEITYFKIEIWITQLMHPTNISPSLMYIVRQPNKVTLIFIK